jgi:hypothetical protein
MQVDVGQAQAGGNARNGSAGESRGPVHEVVRQAHEELRQLLQQRAEVMRRIGTKSSGRQPGFTNACRTALMDCNRALSAREVCDRIEQKTPALLARHKDPMASVTTVLNRLVAYGEARAVALDNGRRAWQWVADSAAESKGLPASA